MKAKKVVFSNEVDVSNEVADQVEPAAETEYDVGTSTNYDTDTNFIRLIYDETIGNGTRLYKSSARLIGKDGSYCVEHFGCSQARMKKWRNIFQLALEMRWRWVWALAFLGYPMTWFVFALFYYIVSEAHGDFESHGKSHDNRTLPEFIACVVNAKNYMSFFLYSLESQETIGYGARYNSEECIASIILLAIQVIVGSVLQACLCAVIWARMLRPKRRGKEVVFSKCACIAQTETGELSLMFRMCDINGTFLVQSSVRMYVAVKKRLENAPDIFSFKLYHMSMGEDVGQDKLLFIWPIVARHVINKDSPLYSYSKKDLQKSQFEFISVAEGTVESTGLTVQTRTSYLPDEILWGYRFRPMNFVENGRGVKVRVTFEDFDAFVAVHTPEISAKELDEMRPNKSIGGAGPTMRRGMAQFASVENLRKFPPILHPLGFHPVRKETRFGKKRNTISSL